MLEIEFIAASKALSWLYSRPIQSRFSQGTLMHTGGGWLTKRVLQWKRKKFRWGGWLGKSETQIPRKPFALILLQSESRLCGSQARPPRAAVTVNQHRWAGGAGHPAAPRGEETRWDKRVLGKDTQWLRPPAASPVGGSRPWVWSFPSPLQAAACRKAEGDEKSCLSMCRGAAP